MSPPPLCATHLRLGNMKFKLQDKYGANHHTQQQLYGTGRASPTPYEDYHQELMK